MKNKVSKIMLSIMASLVAIALISANVYASNLDVPPETPTAAPAANDVGTQITEPGNGMVEQKDPNAVTDPNAVVDPNGVLPEDPNATIPYEPANSVPVTTNTTVSPAPTTNEIKSDSEKIDPMIVYIAMAAIGGFVFINFILSVLIFIRTGRR